MPNRLADELRRLRTNPRHYPRRFLLRLVNIFTTRVPGYQLPARIDSIIVLAQEKLGDALLLMPFLYALHERFPSARIDVACTGYNLPLFMAVPFINRCVAYRPGRNHLQALLLAERYDVLYNPKDHPSLTFIGITRRARADVKVCLSRPEHDQHYHVRLPNRPEVHIIEKNAELLRAYGVTFPIPNIIPLPQEARDRIAVRLPKHHEETVIAVNLSSGGVYRRWPERYWQAVVEMLLQGDRPLRLYALAMPGERAQALALRERNPRTVTLVDTRSIFEAAAVIQRADLLVSPDTALVHVAAAVGTPVVGLYPRDLRNRWLYAPYGVPSQLLGSDSRTLDSIQPRQVYQAVGELLRDSP